MNNNHFEQLKKDLESKGTEAAIDSLCEVLRQQKDYHNLFYAILLKKRQQLGVNPIPTSPAQSLPESMHKDYEEGIREAAQTVGQLFLKDKNIPNAWSYYSMLGEIEPVARALDEYSPAEDDECDAIINIAYHQGANPRKGFDLILDQYGICSAITTLGGAQFPYGREDHVYCIKRVVRALYEELKERLITDIALEEKKRPDESQSVSELIQNRPFLFRDDIFHVDLSHLNAAVQMSVNLPPDCEEFQMAREMCEYGARLSTQFQYASEPPFEDQYKDYGIYLSILAGDNVEEGLEHFRQKVTPEMIEEYGTFPVQVLVNLLLKIGRDEEAVELAGRYLVSEDERQLSCPGIVELCERTKKFDKLAELAKQHNNLVHYLAGLIAANELKA